MERDNAFQMAASNVRFGTGCTAEIGMDLLEFAAKRTLVVMDRRLADLEVGHVVKDSLKRHRVDYELFLDVRVEPTDSSFQTAIQAGARENFDSFVAVGGGSTIDTAKAANLYTTYPADFFEYVNAPIGHGKPVPGPLKPLIAVPTTAGTGSETTGIAIFDELQRHAKTGIAHRHLKPTLGIVDANNTRSSPSAVAASAGLDVLCHAMESYTALPYHQRPKPARPIERPAYQGNNPISDIWALRAMELVSEFLIRAAEDPSDDEARSNMLFASSMSGIGFGNAGVHLPHGMSYPVAGMVREFRPTGYDVDHAIVPHGMSVILNAPAVVRFTAPSCPERHLRAAAALGADTTNCSLDDAGSLLAETIIGYMKRLQMPNGLNAVGYTAGDISALVQGALPQHRVTKLSPKPVDEAAFTELFRDSLTIW